MGHRSVAAPRQPAFEIDGVYFPSKMVICPRCEGRGSHDHPAFSNGITSSEWNGPDWDDESRETYLSGGYDVSCSECAGLRVVAVPDVRRCSWAQRRALVEHRRALRDLARDESSERWLRYAESGVM